MVSDWKTTEPDDDRLFVEQWVPSSRRIMLRACLNSGAALDRGLFCIPAWAEYVDKDGTAWSRSGLLDEWMRCEAGGGAERILSNALLESPGMVMLAFKNWIHAQVRESALVHVVNTPSF